jgi:two-component sensor histidine kinase
MSELDHRVRNNLGVVLGLAELTARSAGVLEDFAPAFLGRVRALATVHDALGERHWLDVDLTSLFSRIVQQQVTLTEGRLHLKGPPVSIAAIAVQPLGLVVHELARNALLHGAWSVPDGSVHLSWTEPVAGSSRIMWEEHGGPAPSAPAAQRAGLGLVQDLVKYELRGNAVIEFPPAGIRAVLTCRLTVPPAAPPPGLRAAGVPLAP